MPRQDKTLNRIRAGFIKVFGDRWRSIKIAGGPYQERGLPDLLILTEERIHFWIEIKRDWDDTPSRLQTWNIMNLSKYGFITGYAVGDEFKERWIEKPIDIIEYLEAVKNKFQKK